MGSIYTFDIFDIFDTFEAEVRNLWEHGNHVPMEGGGWRRRRRNRLRGGEGQACLQTPQCLQGSTSRSTYVGSNTRLLAHGPEGAWLSEATHQFWAHESSAESQGKALKTMLGPIERPKLQPTGFPMDFLQHVQGFNDWTAARGDSMRSAAVQLREGVVFKVVWSSENIVERGHVSLSFSEITSATIFCEPKWTIPSVKKRRPYGRARYQPIQTVRLCPWMNPWCWNTISASSNPTGLLSSVFHPWAVVNICYSWWCWIEAAGGQGHLCLKLLRPKVWLPLGAGGAQKHKATEREGSPLYCLWQGFLILCQCNV